MGIHPVKAQGISITTTKISRHSFILLTLALSLKLLPTSNLFSIPIILSFQECRISGIICNLLGLDFPFIIPWRFNQGMYVSIVCSCSLLGSVSWCGCTAFCLTIHSLKDICSYCCLLWVNEVKVVQSCPTLCDPIDVSLPGSSVHGLLQARILPFPSPGDLSNPGIELGSPTLQSNSLPSEPPGKPLLWIKLL